MEFNGNGNNNSNNNNSGNGGSGDDYGNTCNAAHQIGLNATVNGSIEHSGDIDYFVVNIPSSGHLTVYTTGGSDTFGYLKDSGCSTITYNDDAGGNLGLNFRISRDVSPGTYYIAVRCYDGNTGNYTLHVEFHLLVNSVWAMKIPAFWHVEENPLDHTYIEASNGDAWGCFGANQGGTELSGTRTDGRIDLTTVEFMANESPCKWPYHPYYGVIGFCHQLANRALYYTGKTVHNAGGYALTTSLCGTYGNYLTNISDIHSILQNSIVQNIVPHDIINYIKDHINLIYEDINQYSFRNCLARAPRWEGDSFINRNGLDGSFRNFQDIPGPDDEFSNKEIALYKKYYLENNTVLRSGQSIVSPYLRRQMYLDDLFVLQIHERLGENFPEDKIENLLRIRRRFYREKRVLDLIVISMHLNQDQVTNLYNNLLNNFAKYIKTVLTPSEYERLFNLKYNSSIDIRNFR